jgi:hypothetical protein
MMERKLQPKIQSQSKGKSMKYEITTSKEPFWKKFSKPITNATVIGSVTALVIPLSALGVLALSKCGGTLQVQLNPFELQLIKGSCNTPLDKQMK